MQQFYWPKSRLMPDKRVFFFPLICQLCDNWFSSIGDVYKHFDCCISSQRSLLCGHCAKRWTSWSDFVRHLNVRGMSHKPPCAEHFRWTQNATKVSNASEEIASSTQLTNDNDVLQTAMHAAGIPTPRMRQAGIPKFLGPHSVDWRFQSANPSFIMTSHSCDVNTLPVGDAVDTIAASDGNMLPHKFIPRDELQEVRLVTSGNGKETCSPNMPLNQIQDMANGHDLTVLQRTDSISGSPHTLLSVDRPLSPIQDTMCPMHAIAKSTTTDMVSSVDTNNVCIPLTLWEFVDAHCAHKTQRVHSLLRRNEFLATILAAFNTDNRSLTPPELKFLQSSITCGLWPDNNCALVTDFNALLTAVKLWLHATCDTIHDEM